MCGIVATYSLEKKDMRASVTRLLQESQTRGSDASGIACIDVAYKKNRLLYHKAATAPKELTQQEAYTKFINSVRPVSFIAHARAKTKGLAEDNNNNHPIVTTSGIAVVHNGIVTNDEDLTEEYGLTRRGQVDSEVIPLLIEQFVQEDDMPVHRAIIKMASIVRGSMACAVISAAHPADLWVFCSTSPLEMVIHLPTKTMHFASTKDILLDALIETEFIYGIFPTQSNINEFSFAEGQNNTLYHINPDGIAAYTITRPEWKTVYGTGYSGGWNDGDKPVRLGGKTEAYYTTAELEKRRDVLYAHREKNLLTKRERKELRKIERKLEIRQQLYLKDVN